MHCFGLKPEEDGLEKMLVNKRHNTRHEVILNLTLVRLANHIKERVTEGLYSASWQRSYFQFLLIILVYWAVPPIVGKFRT